MKNFIKQQLERHAERQRTERDKAIDGEFRVKEKSGRLWLMCGGIAIQEFTGYTDTASILETVEKARSCARDYASLKTARI